MPTKRKEKVFKLSEVKLPRLTGKNKGPWTVFWDMHSGGGQKEEWAHIYIQAPEEEARVIFYNRFGHSPDRVTCTCCGEDYAVSEEETLAQASGYHRNCECVNVKIDGKVRALYVEEDDTHYVKYGGKVRKHIPFEKFLKKPEGERGPSLLIFKEDIKPEERRGNVPEQGYVWRD